MKRRLLLFFSALVFIFASFSVRAQCDFIPSTTASIDTLSYAFAGGIFASYGCAPIDPTYWLSGSGNNVLVTFVNPESYPAVRVWGMNDDDSASFEVNGMSYPLNASSGSYSPKVICGVSPGPDGIIFSNGNIVGANSNAAGNYSYQDVTINSASVVTIKVTGVSGAGWGFAGTTVNCLQLPVAGFTSNPNSICPGTCLNFTNLSQNALNCQWIFPGASPSADTSYSPSNICYYNSGSYDVTLIVSNPGGTDTLTLNNYITVYPSPLPQGIAQNGDTLFANQGAAFYQWYHGGNIIPGATDYFYIATEGGDYNVVATDLNGCEVEAAIFDVIAGMPSSAFYSQPTLFPNPAREKLVIGNQEPDNEISIYNVLGEIVMTFPPSAVRSQNTILDISKLPPGLYYLQASSATTPGGVWQFRTKFIKL